MRTACTVCSPQWTDTQMIKQKYSSCTYTIQYCACANLQELKFNCMSKKKGGQELQTLSAQSSNRCYNGWKIKVYTRVLLSP